MFIIKASGWYRREVDRENNYLLLAMVWRENSSHDTTICFWLRLGHSVTLPVNNILMIGRTEKLVSRFLDKPLVVRVLMRVASDLEEEEVETINIYRQLFKLSVKSVPIR